MGGKVLSVAVNLLYWRPGGVGGSEVYFKNLLREIEKIELCRFTVLVWGGYASLLAKEFQCVRYEVMGAGYSPYARIIYENAVLVSRLRRGGCNLLFSPANIGAPFMLLNIPQIVTVHDMQHYDMANNFNVKQRFARDVMMGRSLGRCARVIAVSEFTKERILRRFPGVRGKVDVVHEGVDSLEGPSYGELRDVRDKYEINEKYFYYPAMMAPHKNHCLILRVLQKMRESDGAEIPLVIFTGSESVRYKEVMGCVKKLGLTDKVRHLGYIPRRDVVALVKGSVAILYPSKYEGFGLPILEAQSLGVPVIASNIPVVREISGGTVLLENVDDVGGWARRMFSIMNESKLRREIIRKGKENVSAYSWSRCARETVNVFRSVAAGD